MSKTDRIPSEALEFLGDVHPLLEQLGSTDGLFSLHGASASLQAPKIQDLPSLTRFLESYLDQILLPLDLPAIHRAHSHASLNQCRELLGLDGELAAHPILRDFAPASRRIGQGWLKRLRPLRDQRLVQRYLQAVENGNAQGWHSIVYGITLAVYSLPVRQGLQAYARQTLRGFIHAAAGPLRLSEQHCHHLLAEISPDLPRHMEKILSSDFVMVRPG